MKKKKQRPTWCKDVVGDDPTQFEEAVKHEKLVNKGSSE